MQEFSFENTITGFEKLLTILQGMAIPSETKIGLESTGVYGNTLCAFLRRNGFEIQIFNALLIKKSIQSTTLRKTKTDKADARFLAWYLTQALSQPDSSVSYHISELKSLCRGRFTLLQQRSKAKTQVKTLLVQLFPEYMSFFSSVFGAASTSVLKEYPSASAIAKSNVSDIASILNKASRRRFGEEKAAQLVELAKQSVGINSAALEIELQFLLAQIDLITQNIQKFEAKIKSIMKELKSPITSIPGVGLVLGATILAEIGDISAFATPAKLLAFAGMDPSVCQSGSSVSSPGRMVKRGSKYLRWALGLASRSVSRYAPVFHDYLQKKLSEGKHYNVACSHVAKKLTRVIFAILKNNSLYSPFYSSLTA
jgi:transposase